MNRVARHSGSPATDRRQTRPRPVRLIRWLPAGVIVLAGLAAYSNSLHGPFIFDDLPGIVNNPLVSSSQPVPLGEYFKWQTPVVVLTLRANFLLAGPGHEVWGFHATNLAIHVLAALTLFGIARRTFRSDRLAARFGRASTPLALAVALVWMLHPVQTQAVTYIIQRKESLMGLFYLLALYCFIRGFPNRTSLRLGAPVGAQREADRAGHRRLTWPALLFFLLAVVSTAVAMGAKQVAATAPLTILLYDAVFLSQPAHAVRRRWAVHLALLATLAVLAFTSLGRLTTEGLGTAKISRWAYARSQPGVILHYLRLIVLPVGLCLDPGWPVAKDVWQTLPQGVALFGLLAASAYLLHVRPAWGFWAVWFFLILAPTSSLIVITELAFDYRVYLSLAGAAMLAVMGGYAGGQWLASAIGRPGGRRWLAAVASIFCMLSAGLGMLTYARNEDYHTALSIWQDAADKAPGNARAHNNYAEALRDLGDKQEELRQLELAIQADPEYPVAWANRGNAMAAMGETDKAIADYTRAIDLWPRYALAYCNRGKARLDANQFDDALADLNTSIKIAPDRNPYAYNNRGILCLIRGQPDEAVKDYGTAIAQRPDYTDAYDNRGRAYAAMDQFDRAVADYSTAIRLDPSHGNAYKHRALAYARLKQFDLAWDDARSATRLGRPPDPQFIRDLSAARNR